MKNINEFTKEDLHSYIDDFEENGYNEYECLCAYCIKCDGKYNKPEDCYPDENNENCFNAYKELIMEVIYENTISCI